VSPRQRRLSIVGALVCLSAIAAHRVRAAEASPMPPGIAIRVDPAAAPARGDGTAPADEAAAAGPLRLTRPLAAETLARVLAEAEGLYRARQLEQARQAFVTIVLLEPQHAPAWLRLGNLHQLAGRDAEALEAYRLASATRPTTSADAEARGKALLNIALLHVAFASRAIDDLDAMGLAALGDARSDVARQVGAQRHRTVRAADRDTVSQAPARDAIDGSAPDAMGSLGGEHRPARTRRSPSRREASGRAAVAEAIGEGAGAPSPAIEVFRGGRAASRP
jgi:tetratricopeptide (TPR) repeat protein